MSIQLGREFNSHRCSLGFVKLQSTKDSDDENQSRCAKIGRCFKSSFLVSTYHPRTFYYFKSYPIILAERHRQIGENAAYIAHPFSLFCYIWNSYMILVNAAYLILCPLRHCYLIRDPLHLHTLDHFRFFVQVLCMVDVLVKFRIGYLKQMEIVLGKKRIALHYLKTWLILDVMSSVPVSYVLMLAGITNGTVLLVSHLLKYLRMPRIFTIMSDCYIFLQSLTRSYLLLRLVRYVALFVFVMHWLSCFSYFVVVCKYYVYHEIPPGYDRYLHDTRKNLLDISIWDRYIRALFVCVSAFLGCGYVLFSVSDPDEILMNTIISFVASIFMIYTVVFVLKLYLVTYSSKLRYHELINQVEKYINHKQFPALLKKRILLFYKYRYWGNYFKEEDAYSCLSEQLRYEIAFHTCQILVDKVPIFAGLPPGLVGSILGCLKPEVYLRDDLIVKAGDIGENMYFIAKGTVAVYSWKGAELAHLEDGAHFGEVALLMKDNKRMASVVAMEITHVYRLDVTDFRRFILTNEILLKRIETLAAVRMHETVLLDDAFQTQTNTNENSEN